MIIRCTVCKMHLAGCICSLIPRLETRTHLVLLLHSHEQKKSTGTGRLAVRCLPNSRLVVRGDLLQPWPDELWPAGTQPLLMFPHEDATPIEQWAGSELPISLIVPDGTWRQASKMRRRVPGLADVPCVRLHPPAPSAYQLRISPRLDGLATLEAIAQAMGALESPAVEQALTRVFSIMVERTMITRGSPRQPRRRTNRQAAPDLV